MSSQSLRFRQSVHAAAALAFWFVLPVLPVAAAAPGASAPIEEPAAFIVEVVVLEEGQSLPAFKLLSAFQDLAGDGPIEGEVDPWDDDIDGPKPPGGAVFFAGDELCDGVVMAVVWRAGNGTPLRLARALAAGRYFLEVESPNGDDAVYDLTLHRPDEQ